jgi:predicted dehydrogenase
MRKIGVVGLGYWGPNIVRNLSRLVEGEDIIACDISAERLGHIRSLFPHVGVTDSLEAVLSHPEVDAVILATPVPTHYPLARRALEAGKHVLVEKPLADGSELAEELVALAEERGVALLTGHTFLFSPAVIEVKRLIDEGVLGDIHYIHSSRVNLGIHQAETSVIWDLAPHDFSILFWWLGEEPARVSACARDSLNRGVPDVAFVDLEFPSGWVANAHLSWLAPTKVRRMTVVGSKRMVLYEDTNAEEPVKVYDKGVSLEPHEDFGQYRLTYRTGDVVSPRIGTTEPLHDEIAHFLECAATGATPRGGRDLPIWTVKAIEAAEASSGNGGSMVELSEVRHLRRGSVSPRFDPEPLVVAAPNRF